MKRFYLPALALLLMLSASGQKPSIVLTFTAEYDGKHIPLDSIFIENLSQHNDTTLYAPDTVLVLDFSTGISDSEPMDENSFTLSQNYPNPFNGETSINLDLLRNEDISITIRDISGRALEQYSYSLNQGSHSFNFHSGSKGYYLLTATGKHTSKTIKMLNANKNNEFAGQCKLEYSSYRETTVNIKSQEAISDFGFCLGDYLRYIGFATNELDINGSDIIVDAPQTDKLYIFEISEGIPCPGIPTITYDFQIYNTVLIGTQCWLKENLNAGVKVSGSQTNNGVIEKYCYDNDETYCDEYGGLYKWNEMMQYTTAPAAQGICPDGWHIPTEFEWQDLEFYLGMAPCQIEWPGWRGVNEGWKLKSTFGWNNNGNGIDSVGFRGLPAGHRPPDGLFADLTIYACWWSSTEKPVNDAYCRLLKDEFIKINRKFLPMTWGISVRCLKD